VARPDRLIRNNLRTRYLITLTTEEAFAGVLIDADLQHLVLADAAVVAENGDQVKCDGDLWIPRTAVKYMQTVSG
jgi:hypothetical protein